MIITVIVRCIVVYLAFFTMYENVPSNKLAANKEAVAVAHSSGAEFVRVEGYVFSHVADEGWIDSCSGELLRYRKLIGGDGILLFTDIKKKHRFVFFF